MNFFGDRQHVAGIFGDAESGKTTYMVRRMIKEIDAGNFEEGFCNIKVRHPKVHFINFRQLIELKCPAPNGVPTAIVGLDQLHKYFEARRAVSALNIKTTEVLIESRQHGFDVMGTTWAKSSLDTRYRRFIGMYIEARRVRNGFEYTFVNREEMIKGQKTLTFTQASLEAWPFFRSEELIEDPTIEEWVREQKGKKALKPIPAE